jgi:hypothetical protein
MPAPSTRSTTVAALVAGLSALVFWRTAFPTITWWDSSSYSLAAATLGVSSPPGSLLLTLVGWLATRFVTGAATARTLALLAGAMAAATALLVHLTARRALSRGSAFGTAAGALAFAFGATMWEYAVAFTPYVLTALFTAAILLVLVRWWDDADRPDAWRHLAMLGLLFGLDFSVHRTNALLIPGAVLWILVRRPRVVRRAATWLAAGGGLGLGLAVQLLVIPIARNTASPLVMQDPTTWARFWDYVSLSQLGGGFLLDVWARKAPFWSVQVADLLRVVGMGVRVLPAAAIALGALTLWRRDRAFAAALLALLVSQAWLTVLYFNIPGNYFRSLDRHYLPVLVTLGVVGACGTGEAARRVAAWLAAARRGPRHRIAAGAAVLAIAAVPGSQLVANWRTHDASRRWFARDYAANALRTLPPRAIYFTVGDNDTFPLWYLQAVEHVRPDVRVVNVSLANAPWYVRQLARRDPTFPLSAPPPRTDRVAARGLRLPDSVVVPARGALASAAPSVGVPTADAATLRPRPMYGSDVVPADAVLLDIVRTNAWRDPICVSSTAGPTGIPWLAPYAHLRGLHTCVRPVPAPDADQAVLRANLLARHVYRGYDDPTIALDEQTRTMGVLYLGALGALLDAERAAGATARCRDDARRLLAVVPPARIGGGPDRPSAEELLGRCGPER